MLVGTVLLIGQPAAFTSAHSAPATQARDVSSTNVQPPAATSSTIKHVVIIVKENHSFDNLFGRLPGVDGATTAKVGKKRVTLNITPDRLRKDIDHSGSNALKAVNKGRMNEFSKEKGAIQKGLDVADSQYTQQQIPNYFRYASTYAIADRFFSTILGASFPNHLVLVSGQSANTVDNVNREGRRPDAWGCDANKAARVTTFAKGRLGRTFPALASNLLLTRRMPPTRPGDTTTPRSVNPPSSGRPSTRLRGSATHLSGKQMSSTRVTLPAMSRMAAWLPSAG